jgi:hypothetical protein
VWTSTRNPFFIAVRIRATLCSVSINPSRFMKIPKKLVEEVFATQKVTRVRFESLLYILGEVLKW